MPCSYWSAVPTPLFIYISQLLRDSFSIYQQPSIWEPPSHYSMGVCAVIAQTSIAEEEEANNLVSACSNTIKIELKSQTCYKVLFDFLWCIYLYNSSIGGRREGTLLLIRNWSKMFVSDSPGQTSKCYETSKHLHAAFPSHQSTLGNISALNKPVTPRLRSFIACDQNMSIDTHNIWRRCLLVPSPHWKCQVSLSQFRKHQYR